VTGTASTEPVTGGWVAEGWGRVADAFRRNFVANGELGAAFCVYVGIEPVVDLWGGVADARTGRRWQEDTIAVVMSTTKGATTICAHMLVERGLLDLDAPVVEYWPEFGQQGKDEVLVRWLLTHQVGLPVLEVGLSMEEACAWAPVIQALEGQTPLWEPGTHHAYHALTFGFLVGEVIRRASGRTVGTFFADEVANPLGLQAWIGLPARYEERVAHLEPQPAPSDPKIAAMMATLAGPETLLGRSITLGGALPLSLVTDDGGFNSRIAHAAEFPAANMITDARSVARMYAATLAAVDGIRLLGRATLTTAIAPQTSDSIPFGLPPGAEAQAMQFSLGFVRSSDSSPLLGPGTFGHAGAGGSLGYANIDSGVAFGYVPNQMRGGPAGDPRSASLLHAVIQCLG
jgi:CubicO group peptidase (beta-lactamase class C family)